MAREREKHGLVAPRGWFAVFFANHGLAVLVGVALFLGASTVSYWNYRSALEFERIGVRTIATAIERRTSGTVDDRDYHVTYRFTTDRGTQITSERQVPLNVYASARDGAKRDIRYLPHDPRKIEYTIGENRQKRQIAFMVAFLSGVGTLFGLWLVGGWTNAIVLARKWGEVRKAKVVRVERRKKEDSPEEFLLVWQDDTGQWGRSLWSKRAMLKSYDPGDRITLYCRKGECYWQGDTGPRAHDPSNIPAVQPE